MSNLELTSFLRKEDDDKTRSRIRQALWSNIQNQIFVDPSAKSLDEATKNNPVFNLNIFIHLVNKATRIEVREVVEGKGVYQVRVEVNPIRLKDGFLDLLTNKLAGLMRVRSADGNAPLAFLDEIAKSTETAQFGFSFDPKRNQATYPVMSRTSHRSQNKWLEAIITKSIQRMNQSLFFMEEINK